AFAIFNKSGALCWSAEYPAQREASSMNEIGISRLGQVHIPAQDVERATGFYKDILGLPLLFTASGMAFFNCRGVRLMLSRPEGTESQPGSILYFSVPDIVSAHNSLTQGGV